MLPTVEGETVVMRLLDKSRRAPTLEELGMADEMRERFQELIRKPTGALLVTGPTGSGKSTTLYAALAEINHSEINVITVEDPVEYRLHGLNQVQINARAGLTFASALRVDPPCRPRRDHGRRDPGRRDGEDLDRVGPDRPLRAVDAPYERRAECAHPPQRDGRRAVPHRRGGHGRARSASRAQALLELRGDVRALGRGASRRPLHAGADRTAADGLSLYRKKGCPRCNQTGYKGRIGVYQLMEMNEDLSTLAAKHAGREEIERAGMAGGMKSLWDDGLAKVVSGLTSVEELARVLV